MSVTFQIIVVDEAHELSANIECLFAHLKEAVKRYPDLIVIIMSATMDTEKLSNYFAPPAAVVTVPGFQHIISDHYEQKDNDRVNFPSLPSFSMLENGKWHDAWIEEVEQFFDAELQIGFVAKLFNEVQNGNHNIDRLLSGDEQRRWNDFQNLWDQDSVVRTVLRILLTEEEGDILIFEAGKVIVPCF